METYLYYSVQCTEFLLKGLHTDVLGLTPAALLQIYDVLTTATPHRNGKSLPN